MDPLTIHHSLSISNSKRYMNKKVSFKTIAYRIIALSLLALLLCLMFFRFTYNTRDKENAWMWDNFNALEKNSVEALFVGNSHSFCSISTDLLQSVYDYPAFMLSASGQTLAMDYYAILEALKTQSPKIIYLETSYVIHEWKHAGNEMAHMFFDGMPLDSIKIEAVKDMIDEDQRIYFYLPLGQFHSRWTALTESDYASDLTSPLGTFTSEKVYNCWPISVLDASEKEPMAKTAEEYLDKIIALCKEQGIELVLYTVPFNAMYPDDEHTLQNLYEDQRVYNYLADYSAEKDVTYYNLFHDVDLIGFDYSKDFMDSQHLNTYGQQKFTTYMVENGYIVIK